jgi:hypothetical protein
VNGHNFSSNVKNSKTLLMPINSVVNYRVDNQIVYISSLRNGSTKLIENFILTVKFAKSGIPTPRIITYAGIAIALLAGLVVGAGAIFVFKKKS